MPPPSDKVTEAPNPPKTAAQARVQLGNTIAWALRVSAAGSFSPADADAVGKVVLDRLDDYLVARDIERYVRGGP